MTKQPGKNAADIGRELLVAWRQDQLDNWYEADRDLQRILRRLWGEERYALQSAAYTDFGQRLAHVVDPLVCEMERVWNLPRLDRYDGVGTRTEGIAYDGRYDEVGRHLYGSGIIAMLRDPGNMLGSVTYGYLSNQLGEAGHNCPIVCTAGVVRALQTAGSPELQERFLPGLLKADYDQKLDGAQFLTEVQGGSDVGANAVVATPVPERPGQWSIHGEKWFCSNASADLILMTARPLEGGAGTRGLGLFLVPRRLEDGSVNRFYIRRLKEKLGTRAMASGEIDFDGCLGWNVGPVDQGFKTMFTNVINTSRLYNASGTLGMARRAYTLAWTYAGRRAAFGQSIRSYPLVQETLADMRSELLVLLAGHLDLAARRDALDLGTAGQEDAGFYRVALNLNKYRTSVSAGEIIRSAVEILGGNGAIESFSAIPRLLRDNVVYENWEGTHNTLAMQVLRDMSRLGVGQDFLSLLGARFAALSAGPMASFAQRGQQAVTQLATQLTQLGDQEPALASLQMRPLSDRMSWLMAAAAYAEQAEWEVKGPEDTDAPAVLAHFWRRRLASPCVLPDGDYLSTLSGLVDSL